MNFVLFKNALVRLQRLLSISPVLCAIAAAPLAAQTIDAYRSLIRLGNWSEKWLAADGKEEVHEVRGELWNDAIQAALAEHGLVHLSTRNEPYYLDAPIVLKSGQSLTADSTAEIRLKPGTNTCMVRNEHAVGFNDQPVPSDLVPDTDISIEGGIWTTLANQVKGANGNSRGASSKLNPIPGTHGVILLHNVRHVTVKNITVRRSKAFAIHLGIARDFIVDGVKLDNHERDGVHVHGPSSDGVIRNVRGNSHDDTVALNAWDWSNYIPTYGPIHHVIIENISGAPASIRSADSIRLLPGVKRFADGTTLNCTISDVTIRNVTDIREFKFYDQPNLELGRDKDFSLELGKLKSITLQNLTFTRPGVIQIATEAQGIHVDDVNLHFTPSPAFKLIEIGPMSATYRHGSDPARWVEIFSPDRDVTVKDIHLAGVRLNDILIPDADSKFISVKDQYLNPDYPKTTPRGGIGKASRLP